MDGASTGHDHQKHELLDDGDFKIKGAASGRASGNKQHSVPAIEDCIICLQPLNDRAVAVPCNHLNFDFLCLVTWLQGHATCPLCKANVHEVQYSWEGPDEYRTYHVPQPGPESAQESTFERARRRLGQDFIRRSVQSTRTDNAANLVGRDESVDRRRRVYREKLYSLHVGFNQTSQQQLFTPQEFAASSRLQFRARTFLRRELQVFPFLDPGTAPRGRNREFVIELVVAILKTAEIKGADGHAENVLSDYLGRDIAKLLLHELESWLKSPSHDLGDWDGDVQYALDINMELPKYGHP